MIIQPAVNLGKFIPRSLCYFKPLTFPSLTVIAVSVNHCREYEGFESRMYQQNLEAEKNTQEVNGKEIRTVLRLRNGKKCMMTVTPKDSNLMNQGKG